MGNCCFAGCVPVFIGPPYNSFPLANAVDYGSAAVVFNISNTAAWLSEAVPWATSKGAQTLLFSQMHPEYWLPDADVSAASIPVRAGHNACIH